jgi:hypothetical protein
LAVIDQQVSGAAQSADEAWLSRVISEFFAKRGDVDVHAAVEDVVMAVADFIDELFS